MGYALPRQEEEEDDDGGGLLGLGFGPDIGLGLTRAFQEVGQGLTGLAAMALPGSKEGEPGLADFGKGLGSSLAGTAATLTGGVGPVADFFEEIPAKLWGEEYRGQDFFEKVSERGIVPALVEDIGNIALVGGAVTAPVRGAALGARLTGATGKAARLAAIHGRLLANPLIKAAQHPYVTAGRALRTKVTMPAQASLLRSFGAEDAPLAQAAELPDSPEPVTPGTSGPPERVTPAPGTVDVPRSTEFLAKIESWMQSRDAVRKVRDETRLAEAERRIASRSPAIRSSVDTARTHLLDTAASRGITLGRKEASVIVGDEMYARMTGIKALEDEYLARGLPKEVFVETGIRQRFVPDDLMTPELETALTNAVDKQIIETEAVRNVLTSSARKGDKGLEAPADATAATPTRRQQRLLQQAERKLERAYSDVQQRKIGREVASRENLLTDSTDKLARIAEQAKKVDLDSAEAAEAFDRSRTWTPPAWRPEGGLSRTAADIHAETMEAVTASTSGEGGASYDPHQGRFIRGGEDTGYAVSVAPDDGIEVPTASFRPEHIETVVRAYQDVYQHPNTVVGTWVSGDTVQIAPSEIIADIDDALIKGAARRQPAIYDVSANKTYDVPLRDRPDIASFFLDRNRSLKARSKDLRRIVEHADYPVEDAHRMMALLMRQAVRAYELGRVSHPDEFFAKFVKFEAAKKPSRRPGTLRQAAKKKGPTPVDPDMLRLLGDDAAARIQSLADDLTISLDRTVTPADVQESLRPFAQEEAARLRTAHFEVFADDTLAAIKDGISLSDDIDPMMTWLDEQGIPADKWHKSRSAINKAITKGDTGTAAHLFTEHRTKQAQSFANGLGDIWTDRSSFAAAIDAFDGYAGTKLASDAPLLQKFKDTVVGEFVPSDDGTKGVIRLFEDANLATLVHENGHLLRRMLTDDQMRLAEANYKVKGKWSVSAEESFANDFMSYLSGTTAPKGLEGTFARVRTVLRDVWEMLRGTFHRGRINEDMAAIFESWVDPTETALHPELVDPSPGLEPPTPELGSRRQQGARTAKLPTPPATSRDFYDAGRKGQAQLARLDKLAARRKQLDATRAHVTKQMEAVRRSLAEGTPSQLQQRQLVGQSGRLVEKVQTELGTPSEARTPTRWQPLYRATQTLAKEAEKSPELATIFDTLPQTLDEVQRLATERGFDPSHVSDFTPQKVRRLVFGNMRLGLGREILQEAEAGTRKARTGTLARAGAVERSVESFLAASVEATVEARTNGVVDWIEKSAARRIPAGAELPDGWQLWDPQRTFLLTGTELGPDAQKAISTTTSDSLIVPDAVVSTIKRYTKDYDHWAWNAIRKVTSPWRTLVLTLSPGWYVRNFAGNVALASAAGVTLRDWQSAWKSYRATDEIGRFSDVPFVTGDTLAQEAGTMADSSLIPRKGVRESVSENGKVRGAAQYVSRRMLRANEVVDEFARAAVYHKGTRMNLPHEEAWRLASEALVDYNALSPFERSAVRSVLPFYSWQKGILKLTMNQALDHPARASILMGLGQMQEEYVADMLGLEPEDVPDYYKHLIGSRNIRGFNPFADPSELLSPEGIARSLNPFMEIGIRKGLGAPEFFPESYRLGAFGTPQADVNVPGELGGLITGSPAGRGAGDPSTLLTMGLQEQDLEKLRSRFLRARTQVRGIPNPETQEAQQALLPPR